MPPVAVGGGRDRLEADGDGTGVREIPLRVGVEDLEPIVGGVQRVEVRVVRRERERAHLAGLEVTNDEACAVAPPARNANATRKMPRIGPRAAMRRLAERAIPRRRERS